MRSVLAALVIVFSFFVSHAFAQATGQINGVVTDSSGGVVPGATVTAVEQQTGLSRDTVSAANGLYTFPSLRPTLYEIRAVLTGFRTIRRTGIELLANQNLTVNVTLELGELSETVSVAGKAANVDLTTATISEVVDHARIVELPLNGRDAAKLTTLVAGTVISSVSTETGKTIPGALRLSSNGSQALSVSFRLDGTSNTDLYEHENLTFPFPEALQEFSIQTSNYSAAQGNSSGAVINAVTRSGTNIVSRGRVRLRAEQGVQLAQLLRNGARRPRSPAVRRVSWRPGEAARLQRHEPHVLLCRLARHTPQEHDRNNDRVRADERPAQRQLCHVRCAMQRSDSSTRSPRQPFPGNQIPVSRFDPASVNLMSHFARVGGTGQHQVSRASAMDFNQLVLKVDHQVTNNDQLSGRYFIDHFDNAAIMTPGDLLSYRTGSPKSRVRSQSGVYAWKRTLSATAADRNAFRLPAHARRSCDARHTEPAGAGDSAPAVSDRRRIFSRSAWTGISPSAPMRHQTSCETASSSTTGRTG